MSWDPFLMKKWLKNEVCGIRKQYTGALFTGEYSKVAAWKKKKKKNCSNRKTQTRNVNPSPT